MGEIDLISTMVENPSPNPICSCTEYTALIIAKEGMHIIIRSLIFEFSD